MKYSDEEILAYARSHIRHLDQQKGKRLVLAFMGVGGIAGVALLIRMVLEKSAKAGGSYFQDAHFISGLGFGIFVVLVVGIALLCFLRMFSMLYGKDGLRGGVPGVAGLLVPGHDRGGSASEHPNCYSRVSRSLTGEVEG